MTPAMRWGEELVHALGENRHVYPWLIDCYRTRVDKEWGRRAS